MLRPSIIESLESRIAPALLLANPISDILVGAGQKTSTLDLEQAVDPTVNNAGHTTVTITLNLDLDPNMPGVQNDTDPLTAGVQPPKIVLELYDNLAPLSVANFLRYASNPDTAADYVGTFLHRSFDFGTGSGTGIDIIQGGGYNLDTNHIATFATVHNEYSDSLPNVRGTIAMAKTALSPNTATSEWFINVNDNSSILGSANNGGFTVFGKVASGMEYVDDVAALPTKNFSGAFTNLPLQNFTSGAVTNDNFIRITGVTVTPPKAPAQPGLTDHLEYKVISVTDVSAPTQTSGIVNPVLTGSTLKLNYTGLAGKADVTVEIKDTDTNEVVTDTFRVTAEPNVITEILADSYRGSLNPNFGIMIVPGQAGSMVLQISNNGGATYSGPLDLDLYLSKADGYRPDVAAANRVALGPDPLGKTLDTTADTLIGSYHNASFSIASGANTTVTISTTVPPTIVNGFDAYFLIGQVKPGSTASTELFSDDKTTLNGTYHGLVSEFGTVNSRSLGVLLDPQLASGNVSDLSKLSFPSFAGISNAKLSYMANGHLATFSMTGQGNGKLSQSGAFVNLKVSGTNGASVLGVASSAAIDLHNIDVTNSMGTVNLGLADVSGYMTFSSGIKSLTVGNVNAGDQRLILGTFGALNTTGAALKFGSVQNLSIESDQPIASLTALEWLDPSGAADTILTPSIAKVNITGKASTSSATPAIQGDFEADISALRSVTMSSFAVKGFVRDSIVKTAGSVTSVKVGGMTDSSFLVGTSSRPDSVADFTAKRSIGSFSVTGIGTGGPFFSESQVAAASIGTIVVKGIDLAATGEPYGFVADKVVSYTHVGETPRLNLTAPATLDVHGKYSLTIL